jgi:protein-S-isoprenylcysteine O-methyltransferase Ste14
MENDTRARIFNGFGILSSIAIVLSGSVVPHAIVDLLVQVFGALMIVWALVTLMVEKKHTTVPLPKGYFFIEHGPYEILRHPIYAGYLLIMVSIVETEFTLLRLISLLILCGAIWLKIIREEYIMGEKIEKYNDYKKKTKALIPYLL